VILPAEVLTGIERQVLGVARHAGLLRATGQHLKRGVTDAHLNAALDQLLDTRSQLTRILLGGHQLVTPPE